jgi:hypothetical protein
MKKFTFLCLIPILILSCSSDSSNNVTNKQSDQTPEADDDRFIEIDSDEALIATALMAAPAESREGCTVIGFNMAGEFVTFKEGTNDLICLADDPKQDGFNAACYHKSLEPFMARGRELKADGKSATEIFDIREEEVKSGTLTMGDPGSTLHIYYGKQTKYDPETAKVADAIYRYVVYMPFATAASTGLPERPVEPNHPWIMNPGTHRAHIMISPINEAGE